ncbi:mitochondrial 37S ribosomal protein mS45 [Lodderomyces beijingensis]|uniref:Uncharacterized protein n=1 Tax=Lodderomyces beijingensis TaxID=1775926 RepID=A0ABP0ZEG1_9ASCO
MQEFLGPKNRRGEYYLNKYYYVPQRNRPNYIVPDGSPVVGGKSIPDIVPRPDRFGGGSGGNGEARDPSLHPFPHNTYTKTNYLIPQDLKDQIVDAVATKGYHPQEVAHKYGINLQRVEAILKLSSIEKTFQVKDKFKNDLQSYAKVMKRIFPLFQGGSTADNLTEIPTPHKTLTDRFLTIEENEPFGPVDAAKILHLEPASQTLKNLTEFNLEDAQKQQQVIESKKVDVVYGKRRENENKLFRFTKKNVGDFGHRYGASRRDRKVDRAIGFDASGKMIYLHPDQ